MYPIWDWLAWHPSTPSFPVSLYCPLSHKGKMPPKYLNLHSLIGGSARSCKHSKVVKVNVLLISTFYSFIQQTQSNMITPLELCLCPPDEFQFNIYFFFLTLVLCVCLLGCKTKTMSWKMLKSFIELRGTAESGDNSLLVHYYNWRVTLTLSHLMHCSYKNLN